MLNNPSPVGIDHRRHSGESRNPFSNRKIIRWLFISSPLAGINQELKKAKQMDSGFRRNDEPENAKTVFGRDRSRPVPTGSAGQARGPVPTVVIMVVTQGSFANGPVRKNGRFMERSRATRRSRFRTPFPTRGFRRGGVAPAAGGSGFSPHEPQPQAVSAGRPPSRFPSRAAC